MNRIKQLYQNIRNIQVPFQENEKSIQDLKILTAKMLIGNLKNAKTLHEAEFKVFSQWGDDGIIQYLLQKVPVQNKVFVEFGVENYTEANTRFLLINNNWKGLVMDGSEEHINYIQNDPIYWRYGLKAKSAFITAENINGLITGEGIAGNIGILSIDIDGNDYWVWKSMNAVDADIVIAEYNSLWGSERPVTIPYDPSFERTKAHYSNLYYGTSLTSLCDIANEKGYCFIGCNSSGNNAYFVKKEKMTNLKPLSASEGFVEANFKESRDHSGALTFLSGPKRLEALKGKEVFNTRTNLKEPI